MARKKRKKEEEPAFQIPDFDERAYMVREVEGAKAALVTVAYAFLVALASYALTLVGAAAGGFLVGIASLYGLKYVYPFFRVDVSKFDKKAWAGNGAIHLLAWIAFWVLLLNPPIADIAPPVVHEATVTAPAMEPVLVTNGETLSLPANAATVTVEVRVTDNVEVSQVVIAVDGDPATMTPLGDDRWSHAFPVEGVHEVRITAFDPAGNESREFTFTLSVP